ncbi:MAG: GrpB family protein [Holosporales bacterium]|jgi:GrpB-like predicted nucleotidyltransferase (UPF0157 family)|nr:GrpB family protein [Holosporales bacterium]
MGDNVVDIQHVGSTFVLGLSAKPIIDMILVTDDLERARLRLASSYLGYRYKGEYNLPFRDLYGKMERMKFIFMFIKSGILRLL